MIRNDLFDYLKPTDKQVADMNDLRSAARKYAILIDDVVPDGPDKTYAIRKLRELAMWVNVAITRQPDGTPRSDYSYPNREEEKG